MNTFSELGLDQRLVDALNGLGITKPTEIQQKSIPILIESAKDFIGLAQTGTGKTAAFGLPLLHVIDENVSACQAVVLAPTRELAQQIAEGLKSFAKLKSRLKIEAVYGGAAITNQIKALKSKPQIIVATPGRMVDLIQRKVIKLDVLEYVVLDEADEMLNMGFKEELNKILEVTPDEKSTWLFSATMPKVIKHIVSSYMNDPVEVSVKSGVEVNKNISHQYMMMKMSDKEEAVRRIMDISPNFYGVMFCRTKVDTQRIAEEISNAGYYAEALHGDLTQKQRDVVMRKFKSRSITLLVATDVAARGIDVNDLTHVLHHKLPDELEYYTHRSGRTARAGKKGISISLITKGELRKISTIEKVLKIKVEKVLVPTTHDVQYSRINSWATNIADFQISKESPEEISEKVKATLESFSKDELVDKLLAMEISKIGISNSADLNVLASASRDSDRSGARREGRSDSRRESAFQRFFINIGDIDDVSNSELLHMISDIANIKKEHVGKIEIQKKKSYFEIARESADQVAAKFNGVEFDGRELRVNEDNERRGGSHRRFRNSERRPRKSGPSGRRR